MWNRLLLFLEFPLLRRELTEAAGRRRTWVLRGVVLLVLSLVDSLRHRQARFGGPREVPTEIAAQMIASAKAKGISWETAGERIADQVEEDRFFIFTNGPDETEVATDYQTEIMGALAAFNARYRP